MPKTFCSIPRAILADRRLRGTTKVAYQVLLDQTWGKQFVSISNRRLVKLMGHDKDTVLRAVEQLERFNYCMVERGQNRNTYWLTLPAETVPMTGTLEDETMPTTGTRPDENRPHDGDETVPMTGMVGVPRTGMGRAHDGDETVPVLGTRTTATEKATERSTATGKPASRVPPPAAGEREESPEESPDSQEESRETQDMTPSKESFLRLAKTWRDSGLGDLPGKKETTRLLEKFKLQEKQTTSRLDYKKVIAAIKKHGLDLAFPQLFEMNGSGFIWEKLNRGSKPSKQKRKEKFTEADCEQIYAAYPRQVKELESLKEIRAALDILKKDKPELPLEEHVAFLLETVKKFARSAAGQKGVYTPYPTTWFRDRRYTDDPAEWDVAKDRTGSCKRVITDEEDAVVEEPVDLTW